MNFVAVTIVSVIVLGHPFNKGRLSTGLNRILLCLNNNSQITKFKQVRTRWEAGEEQVPNLFFKFFLPQSIVI